MLGQNETTFLAALRPDPVRTRSRHGDKSFQASKRSILRDGSALARKRVNLDLTVADLARLTEIRSHVDGAVLSSVSTRTIDRAESTDRTTSATVSDESWNRIVVALSIASGQPVARRSVDPHFV